MAHTAKLLRRLLRAGQFAALVSARLRSYYPGAGAACTRPFSYGRGFFMLDQLRQGAQGWVSKLLMAVLVLSFAIWGIGGFNGYHADRLASVGNAEVSVQEFSRLYEQARR